MCRYYKPSYDWHSHIINETVHMINREYGSAHALTLSVSRLLETTGFMEDAQRLEKFQGS